MSAAFAIETLDAGRARLCGRLGFAEAAAALPQGMALVAAGRANGVELDLAALEGVDSATLAVLLAWAADATSAGTRLRYVQVPEGLRALARLCDAEPLLGLA